MSHVCVLDQIVERGTHAELMGAGGVYKALVTTTIYLQLAPSIVLPVARPAAAAISAAAVD